MEAINLVSNSLSFSVYWIYFGCSSERHSLLLRHSNISVQECGTCVKPPFRDIFKVVHLIYQQEK
jgi:hypothetical protein